MSAATSRARLARPAPPPDPRRTLRALPAGRRAPRLPFALLTVGVVVAGVLALLALNVRVNQQAFEIGRLQDDDRRMAADYTLLRAQVAALQAPARLAQVAAQRGLVPAGPPRVVTWPGSRPAATAAVGAPASPGPTASPGAATSPAAPGDGSDARTAGWPPDDDPVSIKQYLAEP